MDYEATIRYLYTLLPYYQKMGGKAINKSLDNTLALCQALGNPQEGLSLVHIAGTNGKGSSAHALASILACCGYKTGLYTSPHLKKFNERIRIDGQEISDQVVVDFVAEHDELIQQIGPSFFELTVAMAFWYFAESGVEVAVIETGLGGRLDSTNIIRPLCCLITSIGYDHMDYLGDTLEQIAGEKAGIIKAGVPVVIATKQAETTPVFRQKAEAKGAPLYFAEDFYCLERLKESFATTCYRVAHRPSGQERELATDLTGHYQVYNLPGILKTVDLLRSLGWQLPQEKVGEGLCQVKAGTGLRGRMQLLQEAPLVLADTAHNLNSVEEVVRQLASIGREPLWLVLGMVREKDHPAILELFPANAHYVYTAPALDRAIAAEKLAATGEALRRQGLVIPEVNRAYAYALEQCPAGGMVFVGGSTFTVAELEDV